MKPRHGQPMFFLPMFAALATSAPAAAGDRMLRDKTLVAWVLPANLAQRGGSAVTLIDKAEHSDAIVLGEAAQGKWMAGSLIEVYLDDLLMQCYSLPLPASGRIGIVPAGDPAALTALRAWYPGEP